MKYIAALIIGIVLTGCANKLPNYSAAEIESQQMAFITTKGDGGSTDRFATHIFAVADSENQKIAERAMGGDLISELYLPAGIYRVELECGDASGSAFPIVIASLEKSKSYRLSCEVSETKKAWLTGVELVTALKAKIVEI